MNTTATILKAARDLIAKPENWTQGEYARNAANRGVWEHDSTANCFCSIGAIARVMECDVESAEHSYAVRVLAKANDLCDSQDVIAFNDEVTHSEVLGLFSKAIKAAEGEQS